MPNAYETANKKASPGEVTGWQAIPTRGEEVRMRETLVESGEPKPAEETPEGIREETLYTDSSTDVAITLDVLLRAMTE